MISLKKLKIFILVLSVLIMFNYYFRRFDLSNSLYYLCGQNGKILISCKFFSKMSVFWNYLEKCFCLKIEFLKLEFQWKTRFTQNWVIGKNLKNFTWNSSFITRGISLNSFRIWTFCWKVCAKGTKANFLLFFFFFFEGRKRGLACGSHCLGKCLCLKIEFLKLEFQWKTRFTQNRVIGKNLKNFT